MRRGCGRTILSSFKDIKKKALKREVTVLIQKPVLGLRECPLAVRMACDSELEEVALEERNATSAICLKRLDRVILY